MGFYAYFNDPSQQIVDKVSFVQKKPRNAGPTAYLLRENSFAVKD